MIVAEQADARERRSRADLQLKINRRRPVIGVVRLLQENGSEIVNFHDVHACRNC